MTTDVTFVYKKNLEMDILDLFKVIFLLSTMIHHHFFTIFLGEYPL